MKKLTLVLLGSIVGAGFTACTTVDSRIKEKDTAFAQLSSVDQEVIRSGFIKIGFTQEMVYMVMAKPEHKILGAIAGEETWIYNRVVFADGGSPESPRKLMANYAGADAVIRLRVKFVGVKVKAVEAV